jgi:hypothetical protein
VILGVLAAVVLWHSVRANDGHFVFALDDPYIHLSMARSLAVHGIWGVAPTAFSATSSAPFYTLLLAAAFLIGGASEFWAWLIAMAGGLAVAAILARRVSRYFSHSGIAVLVGVWAVVIIGLPETMFTGMEHSLHTLVVLLMAGAAASTGRASGWSVRSDALLAVLVLIGCGLRYETLFLMPALFGYLYWTGRRQAALMAGIAAVLPALVLGLIQLANAQMLLPNTLMLKGVIGYNHRLSYFTRFLYQIGSSYLSILIALVAVGTFLSFLRRTDAHKRSQFMCGALFLSGCLLHSAFAQVARRYVGYLIALGIWAAIPWISEWTVKARSMISPPGTAGRRAPLLLVWTVLACVALFPFADRFIDLQRLWYLGQDTYAQQYQVARFFSSEYPGKTVALNDIGTTSWFGENPVLDLWGLADADIARLRLSDRWTLESIREYSEKAGVEIIATYPDWFARIGGLPREWRPVGSWQLPRGIQVNVAEPQVVFFATTQEAAELLKVHLRSFAPKLPAGVIFTPYL